MKGMDLPVNKTFGMAIFIIVTLLVVVFIFMIPKTLGGVDALKQSQINDAKVKQLETLNAFYVNFKKTDGGFDSYEASVLLAKVIEYTWEDCANFCEKTTDVSDFTNFFLTHPITLSKTLDCDTPYVYDKDTEHKISKGRIGGYCKESDIGADKTGTADEWTTTIWGLYRNSVMCTNYFADGYQWGNFKCEGEDSIKSELKCNPRCGKGKDLVHEITQDRINSWEGKMELGKTYNIIRVEYSPDCTWIKGYLPFSDQACMKVDIGAADTTSTTTTASADSTTPAKGAAIKFIAVLKDSAGGSGISGKTVELLGYDSGDKYLRVINVGTTDSAGVSEISFAVTSCDTFKVRAKFEGEGLYKDSISSAITITPSGGGC